MDENPCESPQAEHRPVSTRFNRDQLRTLFQRQKRMLPAFAIQFLYLPFSNLLATPYVKHPLLYAAIVITMVVAISFCMVAVFRLAQPLWGKPAATVIAMFMFVPYAALVVLVTLNGNVKRILRSHGIEVGLFGTEEESI